MIEHLKELAEALPLETRFEYPLPDDVSKVIQIPADVTGSFSQNVYLKEHLAPVLKQDNALTVHYWLIQRWGGIGSFKKNDKNDARISKFKKEIQKGKLTVSSFDRLSSLSKLSSFWEPAEYAIYDSRAVFSLNWIIFRYSKDKQLFPQPLGRNEEILKYDLETLFRLSGIDHQYRSKKTAYHEYCSLLRKLSEQIYGPGMRPYRAEMLLFVAAETKIIDDIKRSVTVTINVENGTPERTGQFERS
jgi:hypothetical protein